MPALMPPTPTLTPPPLSPPHAHLDGVDLVLVAAEGLEWRRLAHAAHGNEHVGGAAGEGGVVAPVHVQGSRCVGSRRDAGAQAARAGLSVTWHAVCPDGPWACVGPCSGKGRAQRVGGGRVHTAAPCAPRPRTLVVVQHLLRLARLHVPHNDLLVHAAAQQHVALLVPLQRKHGPRMLVQRLLQLACAGARVCARTCVCIRACACVQAGSLPRHNPMRAHARTVLAPDARQAIVRARGQQRPVAIPVQGRDVARLGLRLGLVQQHGGRGVAGARGQVPYPGGAVAGPLRVCGSVCVWERACVRACVY